MLTLLSTPLALYAQITENPYLSEAEKMKQVGIELGHECALSKQLTTHVCVLGHACVLDMCAS
jgi:hypothetical protein